MQSTSTSRSGGHEVPKTNVTPLWQSNIKTRSKHFSLFLGPGVVCRLDWCLSSIIATIGGLLLVAAINTFESHIKGNRNRSKAETVRRICCIEQITQCHSVLVIAIAFLFLPGKKEWEKAFVVSASGDLQARVIKLKVTWHSPRHSTGKQFCSCILLQKFNNILLSIIVIYLGSWAIIEPRNIYLYVWMITYLQHQVKRSVKKKNTISLSLINVTCAQVCQTKLVVKVTKTSCDFPAPPFTSFQQFKFIFFATMCSRLTWKYARNMYTLDTIISMNEAVFVLPSHSCLCQLSLKRRPWIFKSFCLYTYTTQNY